MAIQTFTLGNGMQVLLEENHAAKVISFNALVKVGSANETDAEAGLCHVIEHMLFKGTPTRPAGAIARDVEAAGGEINAYTSLDQTVFYINMASRYARRGLGILADAIRNPAFDAEELAREKEVILEEIRREQDNPARMVSEHLFERAFRTHPYGRPIIGTPKTVTSFARDQILAFYRRWYSPRNIALIAVGDFEAGAMRQEIAKAFEGFAGGPPPAAELPPEPPQARPRLFVRPMNIQSAYLSLGFHIPRITHADVPAIDVLSHILGGADSSRLEQEIKERQRLVHHIYTYAYTPKDPGVFTIGAMLSDGDVARAIGAIRREIEKVQEEPVSSEELARAKLNIRSNEIYEKETVGGVGSKLAYFLATAGSHEFESRYYQMLSDVRAETVREAARRYLTLESCTAVLLVPDASSPAKAKAALARAIEPARRRRAAKARPGRDDLERIRLRNGITLIVCENHRLPLVSMCAAALGGTRFETKAVNGVSGLMVRAMTKGTASRDAVTIAKDIEKLAGHIDGFYGRNSVGLRSEFLSDALEDGFRLFADVLARPSFTADEVAKERRLILKAIRDQEDALPSVAFQEFLQALYPKHPYGLRTLGTIDSVKRLVRADLVRCHRNCFRAKGLVLSVVGDVSSAEVVRLAEELLADIPGGTGRPPRLAADPRPTAPREAIVTKRRKQQAHIVLGFPGTTLMSPDRYPMAVLNNILSGQGGRLFLALRDRMGLAYSVSSVNHEGIEPGYFAVYMGTEAAKIDKAVKGILSELRRICSEPVAADELSRSRQYLVGTYELDLQRLSTVSAIAAFNEVYGLPMKEIELYPQRVLSVTREDVLRAAKKYITPASYTLAVVKPA